MSNSSGVSFQLTPRLNEVFCAVAVTRKPIKRISSRGRVAADLSAVRRTTGRTRFMCHSDGLIFAFGEPCLKARPHIDGWLSKSKDAATARQRGPGRTRKILMACRLGPMPRIGIRVPPGLFCVIDNCPPPVVALSCNGGTDRTQTVSIRMAHRDRIHHPWNLPLKRAAKLQTEL